MLIQKNSKFKSPKFIGKESLIKFNEFCIRLYYTEKTGFLSWWFQYKRKSLPGIATLGLKGYD